VSVDARYGTWRSVAVAEIRPPQSPAPTLVANSAANQPSAASPLAGSG
jgi:hypothetical protein